MENIIWVVLLCAVLALLFAAWKNSPVSKAEAGTERMKEIAGNISDGARAFLFAEYKILVIFVAVLFVLIGLFITWLTAVCFLIGAIFSVCAGYVGMNVATKANVRTAAAAKSSGMNKALGVASPVVPSWVCAWLAWACWAAPPSMPSPATWRSSPASLWVLPPSRCLPVWAAVSTPRLPTWVLTWWARSRPVSPKMTPGTLP